MSQNSSFYLDLAAKSQRDGILEDESASVAGARSSYGGASIEASRKDGSIFDLADTTKTPILEEEAEPGDAICKFWRRQIIEFVYSINICLLYNEHI